jgi:hypothetical protein
MPVHAHSLHRARRPQLETRTSLVPLAVAREIVDEASRWLGVRLPARYAAGLAHRARRIYAHSPAFREKLHRPGDAGRDLLWIFMRHWLADRLHREAPALYRRLPADYAAGADLPPRAVNDAEPLSPDARLLA